MKKIAALILLILIFLPSLAFGDEMTKTEMNGTFTVISYLFSGLVGALVGGALSFLGSLYSTKKLLAYQDEQAKIARDIDIVLKFDERFNTEHFRKIRKEASRSIRDFRDYLKSDHKSKKYDPNDLLLRVYGSNDVPNIKEDVFDFFELIGLLFRRYSLDEELVWSLFYPWIEGYWHVGKEYILEEQKDDDTTWEDFKYLFNKLTEVEKERCKTTDKDLIWNEKDCRDFLEDEMRL
ncbi:MAG: hypothetical protein ABSC11_09380 [Smithella sp.]|jgi:hypothetical protein